MLHIFKRFMMLWALAAAVSLAGCLPDEKDPATVSDAGKITGSYYASGMGNTALQIQNAVVGNTSWFENLTGSMELNLANMGINPNGMGVPLKSHICPTGTGVEVRQFTWLDGRDPATGKFHVRGIGSDVSSIVSALRTRVAGEQVGAYVTNGSIALASGETMAVPGSCAGLNIPEGAPVLVFTIARPAKPVSDLARTEYRTQECGVDAQGRDRRGTMVQKRTVRYTADGAILNGNWETENMGQCVDDVVVQVTQRDFHEGEARAGLDNFAAVALRDLLQQQLQMDCTTATVESLSEQERRKHIDTCSNVQAQGRTTIQQTGTGGGTDNRYLQCGGDHLVAAMRFVNLLGDGESTTRWTSGGATIVRTVDTSTKAEGSNDNLRHIWLGTDIGCYGHEDFFVQCDKIPGAPALAARKSNERWALLDLKAYIQGDLDYVGIAIVGTTFGGVVGTMLAVALAVALPGIGLIIGAVLGFLISLLFGTTTMTGAYATLLNPDYFTGTEIVKYAGTTTRRDMEATSWINPRTFQPRTLPASAWRMHDNQCLWSTRTMLADCPLTIDPAKLGSWTPTSISPYQDRPIALQPGVRSSGSSAAASYYNALLDQRDSAGNPTLFPAKVEVHWKRCGLFGCKRWSDAPEGPGQNTYIRAWDTVENGSQIRTTLLNKEGVLLAHKPEIEEDKYLNVRQRGFAEALRCGRTEESTFTWPVVYYYQSCGGKGGCHTVTHHGTTTITKATVQEWSGTSYESGTWSKPVVGYRSAHGQWADLESIPNPIPVWITGNFEFSSDLRGGALRE